MNAGGHHLRRRPWWARWWAIGSAAVLVAGGAAGGVIGVTGWPAASSGSGPAATAGPHRPAGPSRAVLQAKLTAALAITPANGTTGVALDTPVTVSTTSGRLTSVQVTGPGGAALSGTLAPNGVLWQSSGPLQPGASYQVSATVTGADGVSAHSAAAFTTLTPDGRVTGSIWPDPGMTVGVGQPVVIRFNHPIGTAAAQAAVLSHFTVTESQPVPGGWHWFSPVELHFRPQVFWPTGEKVSVAGDLDGWDAGSGRWGSGKVSTSFTIGDSHVAVVNLATYQMTVSDNGRVIASYPISAGSAEYPTQNGIHIALDRESSVIMDSATVGIPKGSPGYYYETVYDDVHISDSGEYVHAAPWSVGSQGHANVSHGCVNLSPTDAAQFFQFSRVGDVVEVVGGTRPPVAGDHGVMDWSTDWSQWVPAPVQSSTPLPASVTPATPPSTATTTAPPTTTAADLATPGGVRPGR